MMNLSTWRVDVAVCGAVYWGVYGVVGGVVSPTVAEVVAPHKEPPHPGLRLYLAGVS